MAFINTYVIIYSRMGEVARVTRSFTRKIHFTKVWNGTFDPQEVKGAGRANSLSALVYTMKQLVEQKDKLEKEGHLFTMFVPDTLHFRLIDDNYKGFIKKVQKGTEGSHIITTEEGKKIRVAGQYTVQTKKKGEITLESSKEECALWYEFKELHKELKDVVRIFSISILDPSKGDTRRSEQWKENLRPYVDECIGLLPEIEYEEIEAEEDEAII